MTDDELQAWVLEHSRKGWSTWHMARHLNTSDVAVRAALDAARDQHRKDAA